MRGCYSVKRDYNLNINILQDRYFLKKLTYFISDKDKFSTSDLEKSLRICDMGMLMGAPVCNHVLKQLASALQKCLSFEEMKSVAESFKLQTTSEPCIDEEQEIPSSEPCIDEEQEIPSTYTPSLESFQKLFLSSHTPVVIKGIILYML